MLRRLLAVLMVLVFAAPAAAQTISTVDDEWQFRLVPYVWGAGLRGDSQQLGLSRMHLDAKFSDILDHMDAGAMVVGEARKGKWGLTGELFYISLDDRATVPLFGGVSAKAKVRNATVLMAGQYRMAEDSEDNYIDAVAGLRYWSQRSSGTIGAPLSVHRSDSANWVDPMVGVKGRYHITPRAYFIGAAMVGGFDVGARFASDFMAGVGYNITDKTGVLFSYRALSVDYHRDRYLYDMTIHGPMLGLDIRF